ncbi:MAG: rhomboid family intramembrane serine protease [Hyphomicrobiaceae bacterium]
MTREPILNVPAAVVAVLALLAVVHGGLSLVPDDSDEIVIWTLAFVPARYVHTAIEIPGGPLAAWTSFVTHQFVHGDITHLLINSAWLLVFGSAVARRIGAVRFLVFGLVCGIAGALTFMAVRWGEAVPMVGASGAISGLMAAGFRLLLPAIDSGDIHEMRVSPRTVPLATLAECLRSRRVVLASAAFVMVNFVIAVAAPLLTDAAGIAWEAHIGGFAAGFLLLGAFDAMAPVEMERPRP